MAISLKDVFVQYPVVDSYVRPDSTIIPVIGLTHIHPVEANQILKVSNRFSHPNANHTINTIMGQRSNVAALSEERVQNFMDIITKDLEPNENYCRSKYFHALS